MAFEDWAEAYALDDEPCTRHSRRQDCKAAWSAALDEVLRGLRSEDDTIQLRAIIASVEAMRST